MLKTIPDHSPLIANTLFCFQCGEKMDPKVIKDARGQILDIVYDHVNEEKGCSYRFRSMVYAMGETTVLRPDGTEAVRV